MSNISANMDAIRTLGGKVKENGEAYIQEVNRIYQAVEELRNGWQGADNQSFVNKVNEYKDPITNLGKVINDYGTFLESTASTLQNLQDDIASAAGKL